VLVQVEFFSSMELPYQPISQAEAEAMWQDLAQVALSFGNSDLYNAIEKSYSGKAGGAAAARASDIQGLPDG
jgi:hypothetical protein